MSNKVFDDNCPGCRPVLVDPDTCKKLDSSHSAMQAVDRVWASTTRKEREAFHNVCCNNSRDTEDMHHMQNIVRMIESLTKTNEAP